MITHLLNRTAEWRRNRPANVSPGRFGTAYDVVHPALKCRKQIGGFGEEDAGADWRTVASHTIYTDPGVGLVRDDVLVIDGESYKILAKMEPSKPEHHLKWAAREQQQEVPRP